MLHTVRSLIRIDKSFIRRVVKKDHPKKSLRGGGGGGGRRGDVVDAAFGANRGLDAIFNAQLMLHLCSIPCAR